MELKNSYLELEESEQKKLKNDILNDLNNVLEASEKDDIDIKHSKLYHGYFPNEEIQKIIDEIKNETELALAFMHNYICWDSFFE